MNYEWKDESPTLSILNLDVIVVQVVGRKPDAWIVTSSHGQPTGEFPTKESAQKYAVKFAATMIEKTLTALSELESTAESPSIGWKGKPCVLLVLQIEPHDDFKDETGAVRPDVFEQRRQACIDGSRASLRKLLQDLDR